MANLPLGRSAYERQPGKLPQIELVNRFFEVNPANVETGVGLLSRPGNAYFNAFGAGPIRKTYSQDGTIGGALFVISDTALWRLDKDGTKTSISGTLANIQTTPSMVGTEQFVYVSDGQSLFYYEGDGSHARATFEIDQNLLDGATATIGATTYTFKTSMTTAYDVQIGSDMEETMTNFSDAINADANTVGVAYFAGTEVNPVVRADQPRVVVGPAWRVDVIAIAAGTAGNSIAVSQSTGGRGSWDDANLTGGAAEALTALQTPDDVAFVSMAVLEGYVLLLVAQSQRIYFIRPPTAAEPLPVINALDFFEAESIPDQGVSLRTVGDLVWCFGQQSSDAFYFSGTGDIPFARFQGRSFSKGIIEGTDAVIDDTVVVVGNDKIVYAISPGGQQRISNHGIEELIRRSIRIEEEEA